MRQTKAANTISFLFFESIVLAALPFVAFVVPPHLLRVLRCTPQFVTPLATHKPCGTPLLMYLLQSFANTQIKTQSIAASTAAPPCNRHLPANQPLFFVRRPTSRPTHRILCFVQCPACFLLVFRRAAAHRPCCPLPFRCASLFSRGSCGLHCAAVWLAWRVVADGQPSFSRSSFLLSPSSRLPCQSTNFIIIILLNIFFYILIMQKSLQVAKTAAAAATVVIICSVLWRLWLAKKTYSIAPEEAL